MDPQTHAAITWLLTSGEPAIRLMTRRDLLGEQADDSAGQVLAGATVTALLSGQQPGGGFGVHPYRKWTGAHWRLVSLAELAIPPGEPRAAAAARHVLAWLASPGLHVPVIGGLARAHASIQGNALAACCPLGLAADPRVRALAGSLIGWQWPDGGWNCDPAATGRCFLLPRVPGPGVGAARVRAGHRRPGRHGSRQPRRRNVPGPPAIPQPGHRPGDPPRLARPALPALLALRHLAGPAGPVPDEQGR